MVIIMVFCNANVIMIELFLGLHQFSAKMLYGEFPKILPYYMPKNFMLTNFSYVHYTIPFNQ